jgi:hypothetical protein
MLVSLGRAVLDDVLSLAAAVHACALDQTVSGHLPLDAAIAPAQPTDDVLRGSSVTLPKNSPEAKTSVCDISDRSGHGAPPYRSLGQVAGSARQRRPVAFL